MLKKLEGEERQTSLDKKRRTRFLKHCRTAFSISLSLLLIFGLWGCSGLSDEDKEALNIKATEHAEVLSQIPEYSGDDYVVLNDEAQFSDEEISRDDFVELSDLDALGRCGTAFGIVCAHTMPNQKTTHRESISDIHPSGWKQKKYDFLKDDSDTDGHLYERSHLLGWALSGLNAEPRNLITGTHHFNEEAMLKWEKIIAKYCERDESKRVLYRVTPLFDGNDLVAKGVRMEAYSIEDGGEGVNFDVFVYNVQPGVEIDYSTGRSQES